MKLYVNKGTDNEEMYQANNVKKNENNKTIIGYDEEQREVFAFRGVNNFDVFEIVTD